MHAAVAAYSPGGGGLGMLCGGLEMQCGEGGRDGLWRVRGVM